MIVVSDTSVLLNLCHVELDWLLPRLFVEVWIPPTVEHEFNRLTAVHARFRGLALPASVHRSQPVVIPAEVSNCPDLDPGETEALALALSLHADYILVDDKAARQAALALHQRSTGIGGILLLAKSAGLIYAIAPCLTRLAKEGRFYMSPAFVAEMLRLAGETP